eukprot:s1024_g8.t1
MIFFKCISAHGFLRGEARGEKCFVILDSGSDVSLLPLSYAGAVDGPADESQVRLRDCHGQELKVAGIKTPSLVVEDSDGTQVELGTKFLVADNIRSRGEGPAATLQEKPPLELETEEPEEKDHQPPPKEEQTPQDQGKASEELGKPKREEEGGKRGIREIEKERKPRKKETP